MLNEDLKSHTLLISNPDSTTTANEHEFGGTGGKNPP